MSTPPKKHNCPILDLFKGCGCGSSKPEQPSCGCGDHSHDRDHAHEAGHSHDDGHAHGHHHDHEHPHAHPHGGHDHGASGGQEHSHAHGHDHAHGHEHDQAHGHSHAADAGTAAAAGGGAEDEESRINADLKAFDSNPAEFMARLPVKREEQPGETGTALPVFDQAAIDRKDYVEARDELRTSLDSDDAERATRAAFAANDLAQNLVDTYSYTGLQSMESNGLMSARLSVTPWSDDYWAIYLGQLGKRYADPSFPNSGDWSVNSNYVKSRPASGIPLEHLSPSEKYDLLVGDSNFTLTKRMWDAGRYYHDRDGHVEPWMGLCHGWSPASYMLPRPTGSVTVRAANGSSITFHPSDIKALATLLWAKVSPKSKFIGGRCNVRNPATDSIGRLIEQQCFDTNPGTWHLAVVNQIGVSRRSMVMDVTFDYEVWNQPVVGYSYRYFNPQRMTYQSSLSAATVSRSSFTNDKFARYRSSNTASIVGIVMDASYTVETRPSTRSTDSPASDAIKSATYFYDLELDVSGRIIGGEWYHSRHPDFLWTPAKGSRAQTQFEPGGSWDKSQPVPSHWRSAAVSASSSSSAPLAAIVEHLIRFANNG
jgi:hypothetical protein